LPFWLDSTKPTLQPVARYKRQNRNPARVDLEANAARFRLEVRRLHLHRWMQ